MNKIQVGVMYKSIFYFEGSIDLDGWNLGGSGHFLFIPHKV